MSIARPNRAFKIYQLFNHKSFCLWRLPYIGPIGKCLIKCEEIIALKSTISTRKKCLWFGRGGIQMVEEGSMKLFIFEEEQSPHPITSDPANLEF